MLNAFYPLKNKEKQGEKNDEALFYINLPGGLANLYFLW